MNLLTYLLTIMMALLCWVMSVQSHRAASSEKWEERVSRRLQRIAEALNKELNNGLEYGRLHRTLASLENEMLSRKDAGMTPFYNHLCYKHTSFAILHSENKSLYVPRPISYL